MNAFRAVIGLDTGLGKIAPMSNPTPPGLDVRRFSCLTLKPYYSPVNRGLIERVRQLDTEEAEQEKRGLVGGYIDACLTRLTRLTLSKSEPNSPARPAHQKGPTP